MTLMKKSKVANFELLESDGRASSLDNPFQVRPAIAKERVHVLRRGSTY